LHKDTKVRLAKYLSVATVIALVAYTASVFTQAKLSTQLNSLVLAWLVLANLISFGSLFLAVAERDIHALRMEPERLRWNQPTTQLPAVVGTVYPMPRRHRRGRRRGRGADAEPPQSATMTVPTPGQLHRMFDAPAIEEPTDDIRKDTA
jgi:hypothetical protein